MKYLYRILFLISFLIIPILMLIGLIVFPFFFIYTGDFDNSIKMVNFWQDIPDKILEKTK